MMKWVLLIIFLIPITILQMYILSDLIKSTKINRKRKTKKTNNRKKSHQAQRKTYIG